MLLSLPDKSDSRNPRIMPLYGSGYRNITDKPEVNVDYERQDEKIIITYVFPGYIAFQT